MNVHFNSSKLYTSDPFATSKVFPNLISTLSDSPSNQIELIYFQTCHHYFVVIKEVFNFDTELQSRQFSDGLIIDIQDESGYQETFQHDFLMQKQM